MQYLERIDDTLSLWDIYATRYAVCISAGQGNIKNKYDKDKMEKEIGLADDSGEVDGC